MSYDEKQAKEIEELLYQKKEQPCILVSKEYLDSLESTFGKNTEYEPEVIETAKSLGVTPAKLKSMREYAAILRKQDKKMKDSTIRRKVAEKFKLKIV